MKKCPNCGEQTSESICPNCGTDLAEVLSTDEEKGDLVQNDAHMQCVDEAESPKLDESHEASEDTTVTPAPSTQTTQDQGTLGVGGKRKPSKQQKIIAAVAAVAVLIVAVLFSTHVICFHDWREASCTEPRTCLSCGRTEGTALGHEWADATCDIPRTCSRCGATKGHALGHDLQDATCTEPITCATCGETWGIPLEHDYIGLTCTEDGVCSRCGAVQTAPGHDWSEATCTEPKTCSVCGATEGDPLGHTTNNGVCERCGREAYATQRGSGDSVVTDISFGDGIYRVHFTNSGSRNFVVWEYDSAGDRDLLVNTIGSYDGRTMLSLNGPVSFEITSSGSWSYTVERLEQTDATSFSGSGDYVTDIFSASSGAWSFTHDGSRNFVVWLYTTDGGDLLVNDIGPYDGSRMVNVPSGSNAFFVITADGNWTAAPAE